MAVSLAAQALTATPIKVFESSLDDGACRAFWAKNTGGTQITVCVVGVHIRIPEPKDGPYTAAQILAAAAANKARILSAGEEFPWSSSRGAGMGGQIIEVWAFAAGGTGTINTDVQQR